MPKKTKTNSDETILRNRRQKNHMAKLLIQTENCKGCGLCIDACPKKILSLDSMAINQKGHTPARMTDESRCTGCGACAIMCPDCVITISR